MGFNPVNLYRNPFFFQVINVFFAIIKGLVSIKLLVMMGDVEYIIVTQIAVFAVILYQISIFSFDGPFVKSAINSTNSAIYSYGLNIVTYIFILLFIIIGLIFPDFYLFRIFGGEVDISYIYYFIFYSIVYVMSCRNLIYFQAKGDLVSYSKYQLLQYSGQLISISIGFLSKSLIFLLSSMVIFELLLFLIGIRYSKQVFSIKSISKALVWLRTNLEMAVALILSVLAIWSINNSGRLIIPNLGNLEQLAIYGVSMSIALLGGVFINPFCSIFFPVFAKKDKVYSKESKSFIGLFIIGFITFIASFFIVNFSSELQFIVSKPELFPGYLFYSFSAYAFILLGNSRIYSLFFIINNKVRKSSGMYLLNAGTTLVACIFLFESLGILAFPLSMLIGVLLSQLFYFKEIRVLHSNNIYSKTRFSGTIINVFVISVILLPFYIGNTQFIFKVFIYILCVFLYVFLAFKLYYIQKLVTDFKAIFFKKVC